MGRPLRGGPSAGTGAPALTPRPWRTPASGARGQGPAATWSGHASERFALRGSGGRPDHGHRARRPVQQAAADRAQQQALEAAAAPAADDEHLRAARLLDQRADRVAADQVAAQLDVGVLRRASRPAARRPWRSPGRTRLSSPPPRWHRPGNRPAPPTTTSAPPSARPRGRRPGRRRRTAPPPSARRRPGRRRCARPRTRAPGFPAGRPPRGTVRASRPAPTPTRPAPRRTRRARVPPRPRCRRSRRPRPGPRPRSPHGSAQSP